MALDSTLADWWFAALDQRRLRVGNHRRTAEVVGVHVDSLSAWIQLHLAEEPTRSFVLRLQPGAGIHDAVNAIHEMARREQRNDS